MRKLIGHPAEIWMEHLDFFGVLNSENLHQARHVKQSKRIIQMYKPVLEQMKQLLVVGSRDGTFRKGIDPLDLYISISALAAHYISIRYTLETWFHTKLLARKRWAQLAHDRHNHALSQGRLKRPRSRSPGWPR